MATRKTVSSVNLDPGGKRAESATTGLAGKSSSDEPAMSPVIAPIMAGQASCAPSARPAAVRKIPFRRTLCGSTSWPIAIPNQPAFAGVSLYTQGGVTSPGANILGIVLSNACEMKIGTP